jgi:hypothetical protein
MYEIVKIANGGVTVTGDGKLPKRNTANVPSGTMSEVGSIVTVLPGKGISFSLPVEQFSPQWEFHIPFSLHLPRGNQLRDENAWGGEPQMFLAYTFWDLPPSVQKDLRVTPASSEC